MSAPHLEPDRDAITAFVDALFRYADEGGFVSLRAFRDDRSETWRADRWPVKKLTGGGLGPVIDAAAAFAGECANATEQVVFAPPIVTLKNARGAAQEDIANGVALSVDCDANPAAARELLEGILGPATVAVATGGEWICPGTGEVLPRVHLHWRLQEPTREAEDHACLKDARRMAQKLAGADGSGVPPVHPMRWPGSWHRKASPKLVRIVALNESAEIDLGDALERLREVAGSVEEAVGDSSELHQSGEPEADPLDLLAALTVIANDGIDEKDDKRRRGLPWREWNRIGMAIWRATGGSSSGLAMFLAWSEKSEKYNEADARDRWANYKKFPPTNIGAGTLFYEAKKARPDGGKPSDIENDYFFIPRQEAQSENCDSSHTNQQEEPEEDWEDFNADTSSNKQQKFDISSFTVQGWISRDLPEPDILLGPFSTTSRGLFVADTGLGKTNVAMGAAFAMASGQPFLHWSCKRSARILFIDGEMSKRLLKRRIRDAVNRCGAIPEGLYFLSRDDVETMPSLNSPEGQKFVDEFISSAGGVDFVFFDNIQSLLVGDMKDEESWQQTLPWVRSLTRCCIGQLWVHHTGHNTGRAYGTKTREWQLDTVMLAEAVERDGTDIAFSLSFTKARERTPENRGDYDPVVITLANDQWVVEGESAPHKGRSPSPLGQKFYEALLDALASGCVSSSPQSANRPAVSNPTWMSECVKRGLLDATSDDRIKNKNRALFSKYRRELVACEWVACNGDLTWSIR